MKKVEFRLRDTKGETIACCLWGKYAEQIESHVQEANDPNMILTLPLYKLHIVVQDDSGTCKLMLLDTEAEAIVDCKAVDLWGGSYDEIEDPEVLPQPIKELAGQSFCFGVSLKNDNVTNGSDIFMVAAIWSGDKLLKTESHSVLSRESSMTSGFKVGSKQSNNF
ncbi:hypothetical protein HID58_002525 [Brassica napus]|uniref:Uncharacterized protein n=1 Tax=Brassica napus TaxID=3708 RepID=A0ABQ8EN24_BRANA|nr:hypothetical protein HID58_002525 [Brassica napus]